MENQTMNPKKSFYKQWWFWVLVLFVFSLIIGALQEEKPSQSRIDETSTQKEDMGVSRADDPTIEKSSIPAEYRSALNKATSYANTMHMSKRNLYDQLVSEYGEKFTIEAAQYAIDNVKADWNANALVKAKDYQNTMNMSPAKIRDQLISEYGEKFTPTEADYAIQHLND